GDDRCRREAGGVGRARARMRYGLRIPSFALGPRTASLDTMGAYLRRAEDLGFDSAVTIDHLLLTPPAYACTWLEAMTTLAALAGVTRTIRLGTMVLVLPLRNPVYFAKEWATLDVLAGGRTILGVGVGWHEEEFALMDVPYRELRRHLGAPLVRHAGDGQGRLGQGAGLRARVRARSRSHRARLLELRLGAEARRVAGVGGAALQGLLRHGSRLLEDVLPARHRPRGRRAHQRAHRRPRRRRGPHRPQPARLEPRAARAHRQRSPSAREGRALDPLHRRARQARRGPAAAARPRSLPGRPGAAADARPRLRAQPSRSRARARRRPGSRPGARGRGGGRHRRRPARPGPPAGAAAGR